MRPVKMRKGIELLFFFICITMVSSLGVFSRTCEDLLMSLANNHTLSSIVIVNQIDTFDCVDGSGDAPLGIAVGLYAEYGYMDPLYLKIIKLMLKKGANPNQRYSYGQTALTYAAANGNDELVMLLIEYGADIDVKDDDGDTPLIFAVSSGNLSTVMLLLKNGASVNETDNEGRTVLIRSCNAQIINEEIVKILLKFGADVNAVDKAGKNAFFYALEHHHFRIADILETAGADTVAHNRICKRILRKAKKNGYKPLKERQKIKRVKVSK